MEGLHFAGGVYVDAGVAAAADAGAADVAAETAAVAAVDEMPLEVQLGDLMRVRPAVRHVGD